MRERAMGEAGDRAAAPEPQILSEAGCRAIAARLAAAATGGGSSSVHIVSRWTAYTRWGRNQLTLTAANQDHRLDFRRVRHGAESSDLRFNAVTAEALVAAVRKAERLLRFAPGDPVAGDTALFQSGSPLRPVDVPGAPLPDLFRPATVAVDAATRAAAVEAAIAPATAAGVWSAGLLAVSAVSYAYVTSWGYAHYYPYTTAQYSVTVRDPTGRGSGWAGVDWADWTKIDPGALAARAVEKCLASRHPVTVEPGRYTTILESQAVADFLSPWGFWANRPNEESDLSQDVWTHRGKGLPYNDPRFAAYTGQLAYSRLGEPVIDTRLTVDINPLDAELGILPYPHDLVLGNGAGGGQEWDGLAALPPMIERGMLRYLPFDRSYGLRALGAATGTFRQTKGFRLRADGPTATLDEMIAAVPRGLLVTRFDQVRGPEGGNAVVMRGYTRDGVWLIEKGKISHAVQNLLFVESALGALNRVEQVGVPQRAYHPADGGEAAWEDDPMPIIAPALTIRDFSFVALSAAI